MAAAAGEDVQPVARAGQDLGRARAQPLAVTEDTRHRAVSVPVPVHVRSLRPKACDTAVGVGALPGACS
jgi:hypothetical protein